MTWYINVYPPLDGYSLPYIRRYMTKEEAQEMSLPGLLGTVRLSFPLEKQNEEGKDLV